MAKFKEVKEAAKRVLERIKPSLEEEKDINEKTRNFIKKLEAKVKKEKIKADVFLGGSVAKKTLIRKHEYDADIFLRFNEKIKEEELNKIIEIFKEIDGASGRIIKGSRNYLNFRQGNIIFEVIPIIKISSPKKARNVTDLSVFHVKYVKDCIKKNKKLADDIKLAKAFVYASGCYGAESYIKGFSGYGIELLLCYYRNFVNFVKGIAESEEQIVLDPAKFYRNKKDILTSMNEAKLGSPIVFIDPTFKERNALAALSSETFEKFKNYCRKFLKNADEKFFEHKKIDENKLKAEAEKKGQIFAKFICKTSKQEGDIAGSKMLKFYNCFSGKLKKYFEIKFQGFEYSGGKEARFYFILEKKKELLIRGPPLDKKENAEKFRAKHKETFEENGILYAKEAVILNLSKFFKNFQTENKKLMLDMGITELKEI